MPHELAGKPAPASILVDVDRLVDAYHTDRPDPGDAEQLVSFGTSGHRGTSLKRSFNEAHILATTQALCEYRAKRCRPSRTPSRTRRCSNGRGSCSPVPRR